VVDDSKARTNTIEALAHSQFAPLSEAEQRLLHAVPLVKPHSVDPSKMTTTQPTIPPMQAIGPPNATFERN
jgi:hypothetical protein